MKLVDNYQLQLHVYRCQRNASLYALLAPKWKKGTLQTTVMKGKFSVDHWKKCFKQAVNMVLNAVKFVGVSKDRLSSQLEVFTEITQFVAVLIIFKSWRLFLLGPHKVNVSIKLCS